MPLFEPDFLIRASGGRLTRPPSGPVTGFTQDSRSLQPGQAFIALRSSMRDGHSFLPAARSAGSPLAIVSHERPDCDLPQLVVSEPLEAFQAIAAAHRRRFKGPVVGITGSAGKTSTKNVLHTLLGGEANGALATQGNFNNHIGVPLTLTRLDLGDHRRAAVEAGISGPGEMRVLAEMIAPDLVIVTLIGEAHIEALGDLAGVAEEKAKLAAAMQAGGMLVLPEACLAYAAFSRLTGPRKAVRRVASESELVAGPDTVPYILEQRGAHTHLRVKDGDAIEDYALGRVSAGMAQNAVLALTAAKHLGVAPDTLRARLATWEPSGMRGEWRYLDGRSIYLDCYNANPASMRDALESFVERTPEGSPRLYIIGGMEELGPSAGAYHEELGRSLELRPADHVFVIGPHAEGLRAAAIANGAASRQVETVGALEPVVAWVAAWQGSIFVKGSRRYQLETLFRGPAAFFAQT